jgi:regulator of RNase E activity RraB
MKSTEQIEIIKRDLSVFCDANIISHEAYQSLLRQIITLDISIQSELIAAEQKGMTDAYAAMSATVDSKGEYYVEELTDDEKEAYYHEEEKKRLANQLNQQ